MGSEPIDGVVDPGWFEFYDDTVVVDPSTPADRAFLAGLRARAVSHAWACEPYDTWAYHAIDDRQHLLRVGVWLSDRETRCSLLTCGVEFDGTRIVGDECHHEIPFDLTAPTEAAVEHCGSVEFLVERAAEWFEWALSWPIERREWDENGALYQEWVLPRTERQLLINASQFPSRPPDRVILVRGVREPEDDRGGRKRWFGKRRGK